MPFYKAYNRLVCIGENSSSPYVVSLNDNRQYTLRITKYSQQTAFGHLKMVFKTKDSVFYTEDININNEDFVENYFSHIFSVTVNHPLDSVYAECYLLDNGMETWVKEVLMLFGNITPVTYAMDENHLLYGSMHGGWGQFQYLHDTCSLMDTAKLISLEVAPIFTLTSISENLAFLISSATQCDINHFDLTVDQTGKMAF